VDKCMSCTHFNKIQGLFGDCKKKHGENAFGSDSACSAFEPKPKMKLDAEEAASLIQFLNHGTPLDFFLSRQLPYGEEHMGQCGCKQQHEEDKTPWENPLFRRRRPARKVIPFEEAKEELLKRKKLTGGGL